MRSENLSSETIKPLEKIVKKRHHSYDEDMGALAHGIQTIISKFFKDAETVEAVLKNRKLVYSVSNKKSMYGLMQYTIARDEYGIPKDVFTPETREIWLFHHNGNKYAVAVDYHEKYFEIRLYQLKEVK